MDDNTESCFVLVDGKLHQSFRSELLVFVWSIGFTFGFYFGITCGLLSTPLFLKEYFPNAYKNDPIGDLYVNLYRSYLYLIASVSAFIVTVFCVRTHTKMIIGAPLMFFGNLVSIVAEHSSIWWLVTCCRILFGFGMGVAVQAVQTHVSGTAPSTYRRRVATLFPRAISSGILVANLLWFYVFGVNSETGSSSLSFSSSSLAFVLVLSMSGAAPLVAEIRVLLEGSSEDVEDYKAIVGPASYEAAKSLVQRAETPRWSIVFERKHVPPLVTAVGVSVFQQLTGVYAFMVYAPILFRAVGLGENASLLCASLVCGANWIVACLSSATIYEWRRRSLFMQGGITMLLCQIIFALIIGARENLGAMPKWNAVLLVVAMSAYVAGFAWSWGPLGWIVPSEILPLKIQSIGCGLCVSTNMLTMFFVTQFFTAGFCKMRFCMHLVILSLVLLMTIFVGLLLPETKGVKVEDVSEIWKAHWFWKKFMEEEDEVDLSEKAIESL